MSDRCDSTHGRTVRQFVVVALVFAAGFAMASIKSAEENASSQQLDFSEPDKVVLTSNSANPRSAEYSTHRVVVDGQGRDLGTVSAVTIARRCGGWSWLAAGW